MTTVSSIKFACTHLPEPYLARSKAVTFPQRSPPWLFTSAASDGLKPAPASRFRVVYPHFVQLRALYIKCARGTLVWCAQSEVFQGLFIIYHAFQVQEWI